MISAAARSSSVRLWAVRFELEIEIVIIVLEEQAWAVGLSM